MRKQSKRTLEGRLGVANTKAQGALDIFEAAAQQLDAVAEEAHEVVVDAETEVMRLREVRDSAFRQSADNKAKASKIRELFQ